MCNPGGVTTQIFTKDCFWGLSGQGLMSVTNGKFISSRFFGRLLEIPSQINGVYAFLRGPPIIDLDWPGTLKFVTVVTVVTPV